MKKFLATILCLSVFASYANSAKRDRLYDKYEEYNQQYFGNKLPKDIIIDHNEPEMMASTMYLGGNAGRFLISFNDKYTAAERVADTTLLHEMCHVKTWDEQPTSGTFDQSSRHGPRWRSCMLQLDMQGAFRYELIDGYQGD
jgi:predicted SprT family Zn-dependent metalloprotease